MPPRRCEVHPEPVMRTLNAHTGADLEGHLLNRQRGEQLEGVEVVNAREAEPQRNAEQPRPRPVPAAPASGAAQEQAPPPPDLELVPEPAAAGRVLVVAATSDVVSTTAGKKAWKKLLLESAGKPPFDYRCGDTTIALQVHANGELCCAVRGCVKSAFGSSTHTRAEFSAQKHATLHAKSRSSTSEMPAVHGRGPCVALTGLAGDVWSVVSVWLRKIAMLALKSAGVSPAALVSADLLPCAAGGFRGFKSS